MTLSERRYDIDWIRVIAIGLLLLYHVAIGFQTWGMMIGFITTEKPWELVWIPMAMLNVWRIPLLFFVSGMGVYFSLRNRNWSELMAERGKRILIPLIAGTFLIVPLHTYVWQYYYHMDLSYSPNPGHLWFLGNIFVYVFVLSPVFFYLQRNQDGKVVQNMRKLLSTPVGLLPVVAVFIAEVILVDPRPYELYAMTWHGFFLGFGAFFFGFCFALSGPSFWQMMGKWKVVFLAIAIILFIVRISQFTAPGYLLVIESDCWIFSIFGFAYSYLNQPSKTLHYLSQAAYPVYIVHMAVLYTGSLLIFPLSIPAPAQFTLVLLFTFIGCFGLYDIIRRVDILRFLFGMSKREQSKKDVSQVV